MSTTPKKRNNHGINHYKLIMIDTDPDTGFKTKEVMGIMQGEDFTKKVILLLNKDLADLGEPNREFDFRIKHEK